VEAHVSRDLCFVLKTTPYKERDLIAVLFSEHKGKFTAIARNGVQSRRFGGSLDLFTASDFEVDSRSIKLSEISDDRLVPILSAQVRHSVENLSKYFEKLSAASCLNELLIRALPPHKTAPEMFKLYSNCLIALQEAQPEYSVAIVNAFILKFTQWLGVQPSLTRCIACSRSLAEVSGDRVFPQVSQGAWVCADCIPERSGKTLSKVIMLDAFHSMLHPVRKIVFEASAIEHGKLLEFLEQHLLYFVPGLDKAPLTSTRFLKSPPLDF
jgi:DNA repair protein RecO